MELRQLRYFLTVAHEGTYGRASQKLHVAQPALSRQIKKLEQELGVELFVRHAHGVSLTAAARAIEEKAQHILDEVLAVTRMTRGQDEVLSGCIRIGISPGTAEILAYPLSQMVAERYPDARFELVSSLMPGRAELLREGQVAFAVMNLPRSDHGLTLFPLLRETLCLIHRPDDPSVAGIEELHVEQLGGVGLVVGGSTESGVRYLVDDAFAAAGIPLKILAEVNTAGASKALVAEGVGATIHVAAMARAEIRRGELVATPIRGLFSTRVLAVSSDEPVSPSVQHAMDLVRECVTDLVMQEKWIGAELL